jgi:hypothetical protein
MCVSANGRKPSDASPASLPGRRKICTLSAAFMSYACAEHARVGQQTDVKHSGVAEPVHDQPRVRRPAADSARWSGELRRSPDLHPIISTELRNRNPKDHRLVTRCRHRETHRTLESAQMSVVFAAALRLAPVARCCRRRPGTEVSGVGWRGEGCCERRRCRTLHSSPKARRVPNAGRPRRTFQPQVPAGYRRGELPKEDATRWISSGLPKEAVEDSRRSAPWKFTRWTAPLGRTLNTPVRSVPEGELQEVGSETPEGAPSDEPRSVSRRRCSRVEGSTPDGSGSLDGVARRTPRSPPGAPPKGYSRRRVRETPSEAPAGIFPRESSRRELDAVPSVESSRRRNPEG